MQDYTAPLSGSDRTPVAEADLKKKNRMFVLLAGTAMLMFTLGIFAGIQLNRVRHIEENLIKYPDEEKQVFKSGSKSSGKSGVDTAASQQSQTHFSNIGSSANPSFPSGEEGSFIIKIGVFDSDKAESVTSRLNNLTEVAQTEPHKCRKINESVPDRYLSFRTLARNTSGKHNVMVGCFVDLESARDVLNVILDSRISGTAGARIYQID